MFDLESKTSFHLRITGSREKCLSALLEFQKKWPSDKMIAGYEEVEDNHHIHCHIQFNDEMSAYHESGKGKSARSTFFKKCDMSGLFNFQKLVKPPKNNICYVVKDCDVCYKHNLTDEDMEQIQQWNEDIERSKKMEQRDKLLEAFKLKFKDVPLQILSKNYNPLDGELEMVDNPDYPHELWQIANWIHWQYIDVYNKPPPIVHMREYVLWIASKMKIIDSEDYYRKILDYKINYINYYQLCGLNIYQLKY